MRKLSPRRSSLLLVLVILLVLAFFIAKPFISTLLASAVLAFLFYPIFTKLNTITKQPNVSAMIVTIVVIVIIILPSVLLINLTSRDALISITVARQKILNLNIDCDQQEDVFCNLFGTFGDISTRFYIQSIIERGTGYVIQKASDFAFSLPKLILNFFIMIFAMFYFFHDGPVIVKILKDLLPLNAQDKQNFMREIYHVTHGIVYGTFLIAILEGVLTWIGFKIAGIAGPLIWSLVVAFLAFVPLIGPALVWVPFAISAVLQNNTYATVVIVVLGIILSIIDNILRPKLIGHRSKTHPLIILLGILGGIAFLGFIGVIIGPLILALIAQVMKIYVNYQHEA